MALTLAWHRTRFEDDRWRPVRPWLSRLVVNPVTSVLAGVIGVFLLGIVVWSGLNGTEAPDRNFSVTFVFVTAWLGLVVVSVLLGDVFRAFNPWRAVARAAGGVFRLVAGQSPPPPLAYPERLGRWPAVVGLLGFVWLELVYGISLTGTVGLTPHTVAVATLAYTAYTFVAMTLFGSEAWLERGETFSVYFGMFSRLAPLEVRDGQLGVRRPLAGATSWATLPGSVALVLVDDRGDGVRRRLGGRAPGRDHQRPRLVRRTRLRVNRRGARLQHPLPGADDRGGRRALLGGRLRHAHGSHLAEHGAAGEPVRPRLHPDRARLPGRPLLQPRRLSRAGRSSRSCSSTRSGTARTDFGTAGVGIDYGLIGSEAIWYVQVGALVVGHVTALVLGHDRALKVYGDSRLAARSQYWMLALMVAFTSLGLYLLSQANA